MPADGYDSLASPGGFPRGRPATLYITGTLITADCLHTQRSQAGYLYARDADFLFYVKDDQPRLFDVLERLAWKDVPVTRATHSTDRSFTMLNHTR